ncbi:hypothetical protein TNCV_570511 [Trichonephila clavipes]|nr:hypothetical protein TNCV_570511 [Trichonephila clavipes]
MVQKLRGPSPNVTEYLNSATLIFTLSLTHGRQVMSSAPSASKDQPCRGADARLICQGPTSSNWRGMVAWMGYQLRYRLRHLTRPQNHVVRHQ